VPWQKARWRALQLVPLKRPLARDGLGLEGGEWQSLILELDFSSEI
jgi:hypothetical protein